MEIGDTRLDFWNPGAIQEKRIEEEEKERTGGQSTMVGVGGNRLVDEDGEEEGKGWSSRSAEEGRR